MDSVSSFVSHELFETITDPDGSEWQAQDGYFISIPSIEIADVCEYIKWDWSFRFHPVLRIQQTLRNSAHVLQQISRVRGRALST